MERPAEKRWQEADKGEVHKYVWPTVAHMAQHASERHEAWRKYDRIYGSPYWHSDDPSRPSNIMPIEQRLKINRCRLHVETYVSRWMKSRVLPMVVTKDGDFTLAQKAKKHNALIEGAFEQLGVFDTDPKWCRDAAKFGVGFAYVGDDGDKPCILRCDPFSIFIDDLEWLEGNGKSIHWIRLRPKHELRAEYPKFKTQINSASPVEFQHVTRAIRDEYLDQLCPVLYSWSLEIGDPNEEGTPGRYCVTIPGADLEDEPWEEEELPFAWITRTAPAESVWGEPLMADLAPVQEAYDRYLRRVDESLWLANVIRIIHRRDAKIDTHKLENSPATLLAVDDLNDIKSENFEISPQLMEFVNFSQQAMQELGRANIMSTTGDLPKNIRSYSAMKLLEDTDMEGLREGLRSRDAFYVRIGKLLIKAFDRIGGYKLMVRKGKKAEQLNYKKIKLPENTYTWTVMPTNFLAKTAEGRMDQAEWLVDQGLLPKDRVAHFIDFPDLESETSMAQAQHDNIMMRIEKIMEEGIYLTPNPFLNLNLLRKLVGDAIALAEVEGAPEERIELLRQLVIDAQTIQEAANAQSAMPQGAAMPGAAAPPGAAEPAMPPPQAGAMQPPVPPMDQQPPPAQPAGMGMM